MDIPPPCTHEPAALMTLSAVRAFAGYPVTMPSVGIHAAITDLTTRSVQSSRTRHRPPEARLAAFAAQPPNLTPWPFMAVNFATICPLVLPDRPRILFLFIESQLCYTLTSDDTSPRRPRASLILRHHRAGWRTSASRLSVMLRNRNPKNTRTEIRVLGNGSTA